MYKITEINGEILNLDKEGFSDYLVEALSSRGAKNEDIEEIKDDISKLKINEEYTVNFDSKQVFTVVQEDVELSDEEKLELINLMEFIDDDADGENCSSVTVEDNPTNRDILHKIGFSDEYIEREDLIDEDGYINVAPIAFKYSDWWTGEYFEKIVCDTCGVEMEKEEYDRNSGFCNECLSDMSE